MKKIILLFLAVVFGSMANTQVTFQKTYGGTSSDVIRCIRETPDGNFVAVGTTNSFGANNIFLFKINSQGDTLRIKALNYITKISFLFININTL